MLQLADAPANEGYEHGAWISMSIPSSLGADLSRTATDEIKPSGASEVGKAWRLTS
jgi:hypothetical protein